MLANLPDNLLIAHCTVNKKVWTPQQELAYTLQSSNLSQKTESLAKLVDHLPPTLRELALSKALTPAKGIQDEYSRGDALTALTFTVCSS
ncbi:hypothetical protein H6G04_16025 [Calothrix membranacea FACHB-236]|nr:hypothetical protein [Calothrix membranacea FACHB-236]